MITVGIPVYNEGKYLEETLCSVLENVEFIKKIIITDNASTDETQEICMRYAKKFHQIQYVRQKNKIAAIDNWKTSLYLADTKYFVWIGGHDVISDNYIESLVRLIETDQNAVVAVPCIYHFFEDVTSKVVYMNFSKFKFHSNNQQTRVENVIGLLESCLVVNQVWNRKILRDMMDVIEARWVCSDVILAMYAVLKGKILCEPKSSYSYRMNHFSETAEQNKARYEAAIGEQLPDINPHQYIIKEWWRLIGQYAPALKNEDTKRKLIMMCPKVMDVDVYNSMWVIRHGRKIDESKVIDLDKIKKHLQDPQKKYVIFGAGICGETFYRYISRYVDVKFFIDNSKDKQKLKIDGKMIFSPDVLSLSTENIIVILGEFRYLDEMKHEIEEKGFHYGETIYSYLEFITCSEEILL